MRLLLFITFTGLVLFPSIDLDAQVHNEEPLANLDIIGGLSKKIGATIGAVHLEHGLSSTKLIVLPKEAAWQIEGSVRSGLSESGIHFATASSTSAVLTIGISKGTVEYRNIRRESFLGARVIDRQITLKLSAKIERPGESNDVVLVDEFEESAADTILLSMIFKVQNPMLPITLGTIPQEGFFSNIAEPLVMIGAVAVAVFLLFTVRS